MKPSYIQIPITVFVPVYCCMGCGKRVNATPQAIEQNARYASNQAPRWQIGAPADALVATGYSPPEGWEHIAVPGSTQECGTDNYYCALCGPVVTGIIRSAIDAATRFLEVGAEIGTTMAAPQLFPPPVDERQATIPHEFEPAADNLLDVCGICRALKPDCIAKQAALTAKA